MPLPLAAEACNARLLARSDVAELARTARENRGRRVERAEVRVGVVVRRDRIELESSIARGVVRDSIVVNGCWIRSGLGVGAEMPVGCGGIEEHYIIMGSPPAAFGDDHLDCDWLYSSIDEVNEGC